MNFKILVLNHYVAIHLELQQTTIIVTEFNLEIRNLELAVKMNRIDLIMKVRQANSQIRVNPEHH